MGVAATVTKVGNACVSVRGTYTRILKLAKDVWAAASGGGERERGGVARRRCEGQQPCSHYRAFNEYIKSMASVGPYFGLILEVRVAIEG